MNNFLVWRYHHLLNYFLNFAFFVFPFLGIHNYLATSNIHYRLMTALEFSLIHLLLVGIFRLDYLHLRRLFQPIQHGPCEGLSQESKSIGPPTSASYNAHAIAHLTQDAQIQVTNYVIIHMQPFPNLYQWLYLKAVILQLTSLIRLNRP